MLLVSFTAMLSAREFQLWSYQDLLDKSDLVVIATPTTSGDTKEQINLPTVGPVIGRETVFRISAVLKGDRTLKNLVFHHYREVDTGPKKNSPALVAFDPTQKSEYLLFLVREADGRYAPTTGQSDPGNFDVHAIGRNYE